MVPKKKCGRCAPDPHLDKYPCSSVGAELQQSMSKESDTVKAYCSHIP